MGLKSGDQWIVPLCRIHHNEVEGFGNERAYWRWRKVNPVPLARQLWNETTRKM
jgi:hypothetical protein